jgi:hypothetical protein
MIPEFIEVLRPFLSMYWREWTVGMVANLRIQTVQQPDELVFSLGGTCPHCNRDAAFLMCSKPHVETQFDTALPNNRVVAYRAWAVMQCAGCSKYILGAIKARFGAHDCKYLEHSPLGRPDDTVAPEIPEKIAADFSEALRCRWIRAYNATAEMCRRAIQSSCVEFGATPGLLKPQIKEIFEKGKITADLKELADSIRLGGNCGAHSNEDEPPVSPDEADAIIYFTRHYLQHVYVIPAQVKKLKFDKAMTARSKRSASVSNARQGLM